MIYLDNAATTPVSDTALSAFNAASRLTWGNPSSAHTAGREARTLLENSRRTVAAALGASPESLLFTSSGTESINLALRGTAAAYGRRKKHIVTTTLEHPAVYETLKVLQNEGFSVTEVPPEPNGTVRPAALAAALQDDTFLVTAVQVCSETGAVLDLPALYSAVKNRDPSCLVHIDGVQGFLKVDTPLCFDLYSLSAHKIHAPRGIAALYIKDGVKLAPLLTGGGQERALRAGTEPVPLIAALAAAVTAINPIDPALKTAFLTELMAALPETTLIPPHDAPHILSVAVPGIPGEVLVRALSDEGLYIGAGSACSKGRRSRAILSMGIPSSVADCVVRLSFSHLCDLNKIKAAVKIIQKTVGLLKP